MTGDLAVWLRAQLDADEQTARAALGRHWSASGYREVRTAAGDDPRYYKIAGSQCTREHWDTPEVNDYGTTFQHIALHDPAFILAGITAKRAIIDLHQPTETDWYGPTQIECVCCVVTEYPCRTLRLLAQPYAGRPGWHNEWSVT